MCGDIVWEQLICWRAIESSCLVMNHMKLQCGHGIDNLTL